MATFQASFGGTDKTFSLGPKLNTLSALQGEIAAAFGLPLGEFQLNYRDVEDDQIEIVDQLDFDYFMSLAKEAPLKITVQSDAKPKPPAPVNPFLKEKEGSPVEPVVVIEHNQAPTSSDDAPLLPPAPIIRTVSQNDDDFLQELANEVEHNAADQNVKTLTECLSEVEVLADLNRKVESIRQVMEQSLKDLKNELVKTKRKNSGIVSREIDSQYVHSKISCSNCGLTPINGKRYKCVVCKGFELCEVCEENNFHSHHPMIRLVESIRGPAYYEELAQLIKMALGNLRTNDLFLKRKLIKGVFGEHISNDTVDVILNARSKYTAEEILMEFHKLLA